MKTTRSENPLANMKKAFTAGKPGLTTRRQLDNAVKAAKTDKASPGVVDSFEKGALSVLWYTRAGSGYYANQAAKNEFQRLQKKGLISNPGDVAAVNLADEIVSGQYKPSKSSVLGKIKDAFEAATIHDKKDYRLTRAELQKIVDIAKSDDKQVDADEQALIALLFQRDGINRYAAPSDTVSAYEGGVRRGELMDRTSAESISEASQLLSEGK